MNPRNQKSLNFTLILRRNQRLNRGEILQKIKITKTEIKTEIKSNYNSKRKLKAIRR